MKSEASGRGISALRILFNVLKDRENIKSIGYAKDQVRLLFLTLLIPFPISFYPNFL